MDPSDRDPNPDQPITAEWAGSRIQIHEFSGILEDAQSGTVSIYDRSDFPFPIERIESRAKIIKNEEEDALSLSSTIQLDRAQQFEATWLNERFQQYLAPQSEQSSKYQKRPPFHIRRSTFANTFTMDDESNGTRYVLFLDHKKNQIVLANELVLTGGEKKLEVHSPAIHTISAEEQTKSLFKATALVADFVNAFHQCKDPRSAKMAGIPLRREYIVGKERRPVVKRGVAQGIGSTSIREPVPTKQAEQESSTDAWDEEHGIERFKPEDTITLDDIGGLQRVKDMLRDVATSFSNPEVMDKWGAKRPQGVLLYGEPGTGKTMLAQALANEIGAEMWTLQSTDIYEKWLGSSEKRIKDIFAKARATETPLIIFLDEFEAMVGISDEPSAGGADSARNAVAGIFKQEMNTLASENPNILVVAATNDLDRIDPSLVRSGRFDYKIYVPMPDQEARQEIVISIVSKAMLGNENGDFRIFGDDLDVVETAKQCDGFSGADLTEIFRRLSLSRAMQEARTGTTPPPISQPDIELEIKNFRLNG